MKQFSLESQYESRRLFPEIGDGPRLKWNDKLLMLFLVLSSANEYLRENAVIVTFLGFILLIFTHPKVYNKVYKTELKPLIIILFFLTFEFIHRFAFDLENTLTIIKLFGYFILSYLIVKAVKIKFIASYIHIIYLLSILSLIFYILLTISSYFYFLYDIATKWFPLSFSNNPTLLFYTFDSSAYNNNTIIRNAGFSWEAGGFAAYLNFALLLHIYSKRLSIKDILTDKISLVLIFSIITTFSTAGYIAMFVILISAISLMKINHIYKSFIFISFVFVAYILIVQLDFLGNKISTQFESAEKSRNRFGSAYLDWQEIKKRPLTGWSRKETVLYGNDAFTEVTHRPNGISNYLRSYGFIYVLALIILWFISFNKYFKFKCIKNSSYAALVMILVILIMAFSQLLFDDFMFRSFLFLSYTYKIQTKDIFQNIKILSMT